MSEWKEYRVKDVAKISTGTTPPTSVSKYYDEEDVLWYSPSDINEDTIEISCSPKRISKKYFDEGCIKMFSQNSLLQVGIGASVGKVGITMSECYSNQQINALYFEDEILNAKFCTYYLFNIKDVIRKTTPVVTLPIFNQSRLKLMKIHAPLLEEQKRIVSYLDTKTAAIDKRIAVLEKKQEVYSRLRKSIINRAVTRGLTPDVPLKDSGVDWIGMIPEHWEVRRMKDVSYMYSGLTGKSGDDFRCEDESKTKPFIPFTNILNNTKVNPTQVNRVVMTEDEEQNVVKKDDLLFLMSSEDYESIAKSAVVEDEIGEVYLNSFCRGLRPTINGLYPSFLNYELQSSNNRDALRFEARGFTRINIKVDRITSHLVTLPPLPEQRAIADYLDEKCTKIDAAVANIGKQIDALKRLKRALINEVVTGKRKV